MVRKKTYEMEKHQLAMGPLIRYMQKICITMNNLFDAQFETLDMTTKKMKPKWTQIIKPH